MTMTLEQKYQRAILTLQAIVQRKPDPDGWDEWDEAECYRDCRCAAIRCLRSLNEPLTMPNQRKEVPHDDK